MTMTDPTGGAAAREAGALQQGAGHQLVLVPLCDRSWRLCDRSVTHTDPSSVIAYVEELEDGTYEAVWVSGGFGCARYASLEPLLADAVERVEQRRSLGALKPQHIPHRPPATR